MYRSCEKIAVTDKTLDEIVKSYRMEMKAL
jgi:hypothetical protein